jgi:hypothetical protein
MTNHVAHTNHLLMELKKQYQNQIEYLHAKIKEQEHEITMLQNMLALITYNQK